MDQSYKYIEIHDNKILITHNILDEYEEEVDNPSITYQHYKKQIISRYYLSERLNYCKVISIDNESIKILMDKYDILLDKIEDYKGKNKFIKKFCKLLDEMYSNKIFHMDFAPRNIGIDTNGDFKLIDLNDIHEFKDHKEFLHWYDLSECEFKYTGLGKKFLKAREYLKSKFSTIESNL